MADVEVVYSASRFEFECDLTEFREPAPAERLSVFLDLATKQLRGTGGEGRQEIGYVHSFGKFGCRVGPGGFPPGPSPDPD